MKLIKKLFNLLDSKQKKQLILLQFLVITTALFDAISVIGIAPLMAGVGSKGYESNVGAGFNSLLQMLPIAPSQDRIKWLGGLFLILLLVANLLSILSIWRLSVFAAQFGAKLSDQLYRRFLSMEYLSFMRLGSSHVGKQITTEVSRLTDNVLQPLVQINARLFSGLMICVLLFIYSPIATLIAVVVFSSAYGLIYFSVQKKLYHNGKQLSKINQLRFKFISEGLGAFREIRSFGATENFVERFEDSSKKFSFAYSTLNTIYNTPRFIIEFFVFSTIVIFITFFYSSGTSSQLLSIFSVFGLSALKLLPTFQQIYSSFAQIRGHQNALDSIYDDILSIDNGDAHLVPSNTTSSHKIDVNAKQAVILELNDVKFSYTPDVSVLKGVSFSILHGKLNAIVGKSGAGKSTLSDILTGLILPQMGQVKFMNKVITNDLLPELRSAIAIVPQSPFVIQGTVAHNVSFNLNEDFDTVKVKRVLQMVGLLDFFESLDEGIYSQIGDGFMNLSGGQRQRIAIARALYCDRQILFLDEPTSSLDPQSEQSIVTLLRNLVPEKTIITISHKMSTLEGYDQVILLEDGKVNKVGTVEELMSDSTLFQILMATESN